MKKALIGVLILAVLGFLAWKFFIAKERFVSVLVFSKTEQFRHSCIEAGQEAIMKLGQKNGFRVDTTEDASVFNEKSLQDYNVVIFLNTTGDVLNDAQQLEFNRFIQAGGGFVGIHAAADTEYDWPWYGKLVGAYFDGHPNDPNVRDAAIDMVDINHKSTKMLPERWECTDEWYNYKDINPAINVLLNLDEKSYEGGTNGKEHPIAWYHDYDGGRAFYTGRGHTDETFQEELYLEHLLGGIQYAAGEGKRVNFNNANVAPEENRFEKVVLQDYLNEPMELDMFPDGKLIYVERGGKVHVYDPEAEKATMIQEIEVFSGLEDGLLGLAIDPNFEKNKWIYLFYSDPVESVQNIARFTMGEDNMSIDMASEKVLLTIGTQRLECCHSGGSLEFGPNGTLFISAGDNTNPHASDGYSPSDEQKGRSPWDAQKSSANTQDLRGKILRIIPKDDGTYDIPKGNLFTDEKVGRPEIYVMGCRNPFRISVDQHTGYLYWGDVGPDAGEDGEQRGAKGHDEVNQAREAGFFGWPYFIGDNKPYYEYDFAEKQSLEAHDPAKPINNSPNNTGARELPPANPAFIWYPYGASKEFPEVGEGGRNAMAGKVFYTKDYPENENRYPGFYDGKLFTYDWMRGWIMTVTMDEEGNFKKMDRFLPSFKFNNPTDMIFGPNGDIYMLEYGTVWFSENPDARLVHVKYTGGNRKPMAKFEADRTVGKTPLVVSFNSDASRDFDGDDLKYQWYFEGDKVGSTEANPSFTFKTPGEYEVKLVVKDPSGETSETKTTILAGNSLPQLAWKLQGNQTFYWDNQQLTYEVTASDEEDGKLGSGISAVNVSIDYLERGFDANEIALGHKAMQEASAYLLGKRLMAGSDCMTCHQEKVKSVGPSFVEIANKYKGDKEAEGLLAGRVIEGSGGIWGQTVMAAHPQLTESESRQMIKYILSLSNDGTKLASSLPAKGTYALNQHDLTNLDGKYILTASYTDKGGQKIGPLTARETITLRHPTLTATQFDEIKKAAKFRLDEETSQGMVKEELDLVIGNAGGYILYKNLDLTGIQSVKFGLLKAGSYFPGGMLKIHLDDIENKAILEIPIKTNIADIGFDEMSSAFPVTTGFHDVYISFENKDGKPVTGFVHMTLNNFGISAK